jgi:acyl-CoA thioester hydrolase
MHPTNDLSRMISHTTTIRVRYAETDQMGFVYYGNYATYFEVARVETLRSIGITYRSLEENGILLPVVRFQINYAAPAQYDDELLITTIIRDQPSVRMKFEYQTFRGETLLNDAETDLVFTDAATKKPIRCPNHISEIVGAHFDR